MARGYGKSTGSRNGKRKASRTGASAARTLQRAARSMATRKARAAVPTLRRMVRQTALSVSEKFCLRTITTINPVLQHGRGTYHLDSMSMLRRQYESPLRQGYYPVPFYDSNGLVVKLQGSNTAANETFAQFPAPHGRNGVEVVAEGIRYNMVFSPSTSSTSKISYIVRAGTYDPPVSTTPYTLSNLRVEHALAEWAAEGDPLWIHIVGTLLAYLNPANNGEQAMANADIQPAQSIYREIEDAWKSADSDGLWQQMPLVGESDWTTPQYQAFTVSGKLPPIPGQRSGDRFTPIERVEAQWADILMRGPNAAMLFMYALYRAATQDIQMPQATLYDNNNHPYARWNYHATKTQLSIKNVYEIASMFSQVGDATLDPTPSMAVVNDADGLQYSRAEVPYTMQAELAAMMGADDWLAGMVIVKICRNTKSSRIDGPSVLRSDEFISSKIRGLTQGTWQELAVSLELYEQLGYEFMGMDLGGGDDVLANLFAETDDGTELEPMDLTQANQPPRTRVGPFLSYPGLTGMMKHLETFGLAMQYHPYNGSMISTWAARYKEEILGLTHPGSPFAMKDENFFLGLDDFGSTGGVEDHLFTSTIGGTPAEIPVIMSPHLRKVAPDNQLNIRITKTMVVHMPDAAIPQAGHADGQIVRSIYIPYKHKVTYEGNTSTRVGATTDNPRPIKKNVFLQILPVCQAVVATTDMAVGPVAPVASNAGTVQISSEFHYRDP